MKHLNKILLVVAIVGLAGCATPTPREITAIGSHLTLTLNKPYKKAGQCLLTELRNTKNWQAQALALTAAIRINEDEQYAEIYTAAGAGYAQWFLSLRPSNTESTIVKWFHAIGWQSPIVGWGALEMAIRKAVSACN